MEKKWMRFREIDAKSQVVENAAYDLKALNPNAKVEEDTRIPAELIELIEMKNQEVHQILGRLQSMASTTKSRDSYQ